MLWNVLCAVTVRCDRELGEPLLYRFRDETSREKVLKLMTEAVREPTKSRLKRGLMRPQLPM